MSFEIIRSHYTTLDTLDVKAINAFFDEMIGEARSVVRAGAPEAALIRRRQAFMRYHGQGHEIEIPLPDRVLEARDIPDLRVAFETEYSRQFSRAVPGMTIEILNWALKVSSEPPALEQYADVAAGRRAQPDGHRDVLCDVSGRWRAADIHARNTLEPGDYLDGPALIVEPQTTTFVSADYSARVDGGRNIWLTRNRENGQ